MGQEFAQKREWAEFRSLDWFLLDDERHRKMQDYIKELNRIYAQYDALYYNDFDVMGFEWMDCSRPQTSTIAFVRRGSKSKDQLMFILNFTPVAHEKYTVKAPCKGKFTEILNSDDEKFGGQGRLNEKPITAKKTKIKDKSGKLKDSYEIQLYLPPLSAVVLKYDYVG